MLFLCIKELTEEDYQTWLVGHRKAETALHHREKLIRESAHALEKNMELLGATGIEDRLQDGVPETIAKLRKAGIKVWVLTGDKQVKSFEGISCDCGRLTIWTYRDRDGVMSNHVHLMRSDRAR